MPFPSFDAVCVGSLVIIIIFTKKKVNKQVHKIFGIFNYSRDHSTLIKKVLKQAGVVHDIKS